MVSFAQAERPARAAWGERWSSGVRSERSCGRRGPGARAGRQGVFANSPDRNRTDTGPLGLGIAKRRGLRRAAVAVARKLAVLMHRIWADGTEYRWQREAAVEA